MRDPRHALLLFDFGLRRVRLAKITLKHIHKKFEQKNVIQDLNMTIADGSFTILLGPSGCGKTTTLRMIAGLEKQDDGELWIGDRCVNGILPGERDVAMVFQNYALYPTMTVKENIEFGLINKKVPKPERKRLVDEIVVTVGLENYLHKKPHVLSGGQRQRVALARAMIKKPQVFLMDEPLSNLDAKLRAHMRVELVELHKKLGTTFVYVTHDQVEAMSMGEDVIVMNQGEIQQQGSPLTVYNAPENVFTAQFIGTPPMNVIPKERLAAPFTRKQLESIASIGFRPEKATIVERPMPGGLSLQGKRMNRQLLGAETIHQMRTDLGDIFVRELTQAKDYGPEVILFIKFDDLHFYDATGRRTGMAAGPFSLKEPIVVGG